MNPPGPPLDVRVHVVEVSTPSGAIPRSSQSPLIPLPVPTSTTAGTERGGQERSPAPAPARPACSPAGRPRPARRSTSSSAR